MRLLRKKLFWFFAFGLLWVLSIDLWAWDWTEPSLYGLPYIILYIALLEGALFVLFYLFGRYYWADAREGTR